MNEPAADKPPETAAAGEATEATCTKRTAGTKTTVFGAIFGAAAAVPT